MTRIRIRNRPSDRTDNKNVIQIRPSRSRSTLIKLKFSFSIKILKRFCIRSVKIKTGSGSEFKKKSGLGSATLTAGRFYSVVELQPHLPSRHQRKDGYILRRHQRERVLYVFMYMDSTYVLSKDLKYFFYLVAYEKFLFSHNSGCGAPKTKLSLLWTQMEATNIFCNLSL